MGGKEDTKVETKEQVLQRAKDILRFIINGDPTQKKTAAQLYGELIDRNPWLENSKPNEKTPLQKIREELEREKKN